MNKSILHNFIFLFCATSLLFSQSNQLIWSDEFDGQPGPINSQRWFHQTTLPNGYSWWNGEIQHYTNRSENAYVSNGTLKIVAKKERFTDQGQTKNYTSARLNSKFAFKYGRIEIKAKLPKGYGTWPAMWMLGKNINERGAYWQTKGHGNTPWPQCGELDIMEHWGSNQDYVSSAIHSPSSYGNTKNKGGQRINNVSEQFHIYSLDWSSEKMVFSVDGKVHYNYNPAEKNADTWPFDKEMYILLNIAIEPTISSSFTQSEMEIDYVRIYKSNLNIENSSNHIPNNFEISSVYPNPFNPTTTIDFSINKNSNIDFLVFDLNGKMIDKIFSGYKTRGKHSLRWNAKQIPSGTYFLRATSGKSYINHTITLTK